MPSFSNDSKKQLETCDCRIQEILNDAIKFYDFKIIEGHRSKEKHIENVKNGATDLEIDEYHKSKHSTFPSQAVDIAPYPVDWNDTKRFIYLAGIIHGIALQKGYSIRWGGNWDMDNTIIDDQNFQDLVHFEVVNNG